MMAPLLSLADGLTRAASLSALFCLMALCCCQRPAPPLPDPHTEQLSKVAAYEAREVEETVISAQYDRLFRKLQQTRGFSGTVLLAQKGKILHAGAYGYAHYHNKDSLSINHNFQLASVSKIFTATAVLMLYEAGKIELDEYVCHYLPEFPYDNITIRHLLNHRSGLCRYMALADQYWQQSTSLSNRDVLCLFAEHQPALWFTPGSKFNYINTNYALLATVVEEVSGEPFNEFLEKHIFRPLGMKHTIAYVHQRGPAIPLQAHGYKRGWKGYFPVGHDYIDGVLGDKGIYSNVMDLYRFDRALYEGKLIALATQQLAFAPGSPELITHNYGFGYRMKTRYPRVVYHFGWWRGFVSCFIRDLEQQKTLIVLCNRDNLRKSISFWEIFHFQPKTANNKLRKAAVSALPSHENYIAK
ncbi:MAG: class A beta-lactamase-related serine hydrolase [Bacteroidetes bacterium]|nr:MAG: class A beta-lactamase-related serine hydrolase [Bacteroidota bacterium]